MKGGTVAAVVAVVAWIGLWLYLQLLNARLAQALTDLEADTDDWQPAVVIEPARQDDDEQ